MAEMDQETATCHNGTIANVVYARMENVVKTAEFVFDIPGFNKYLKASNHYRRDTHEFVNILYEFSENGIMGTIQIQEQMSGSESSYFVAYTADLEMDQVGFNFFETLMQAVMCQGQTQIEVGSVRETTKGIRLLGRRLELSGSGILKQLPDVTTDMKLRIILNVKAVIYKQPQSRPTIIGVDQDHCGLPFLQPIQNGLDSTLPVHGLILKNGSHVFRRMLEVPMKEAAMRRIEIDDMSADTTKRMLDYIYQGRINAGSDAQVVDLLYAAEKYGFDLLKTACLTYMLASMSDENITSFLDLSVRVNAGDEVVKPMVAYCLSRIVELRQREDFPAFAQANSRLFFENSM